MIPTAEQYTEAKRLLLAAGELTDAALLRLFPGTGFRERRDIAESLAATMSAGLCATCGNGQVITVTTKVHHVCADFLQYLPKTTCGSCDACGDDLKKIHICQECFDACDAFEEDDGCPRCWKADAFLNIITRMDEDAVACLGKEHAMTTPEKHLSEQYCNATTVEQRLEHAGFEGVDDWGEKTAERVWRIIRKQFCDVYDAAAWLVWK